jgi:hypothetical protein
MKSLRNLGIGVCFLAFCACSGNSSTGMADKGVGSTGGAAQVDCSTVRCAACPTGQTPALKPPDCCRCVPIQQ